MSSKQANIQLYFFLLILGILLISVVAIFAPIGADISTELYLAQEQIVNDSRQDINNINNTEIKGTIQNFLNEGKETTKDNINMYSFLYKYGGIILLALGILSIAYASRNLTESQGGVTP